MQVMMQAMVGSDLTHPAFHVVCCRWARSSALGLLHAISSISRLLQRQESSCQLQPKLQHSTASPKIPNKKVVSLQKTWKSFFVTKFGEFSFEIAWFCQFPLEKLVSNSLHVPSPWVDGEVRWHILYKKQQEAVLSAPLEHLLEEHGAKSASTATVHAAITIMGKCSCSWGSANAACKHGHQQQQV